MPLISDLPGGLKEISMFLMKGVYAPNYMAQTPDFWVVFLKSENLEGSFIISCLIMDYKDSENQKRVLMLILVMYEVTHNSLCSGQTQL